MSIVRAAQAPTGEISTAGQATVELALSMPLVLLLALLLMQGALLGRDQLMVTSAAREAARAAAVDADPDAPRRAAQGVLPGAEVRAGPRPAPGRPVAVTVGYRSSTDVPVLGPLLPDPWLSARAVMRVER